VAATLQVACFRVADRDCAVDVMRIAEVLRPVPVTLLPAAPSFVEGIIELRGRFLPVIDLRKRFGGGPTPERAPGKYVVAPIGQTAVALVVDEVMGVERIPQDQIQPPPALAAGRVAPGFVSGIVKWNDRVLLLLDIDAVLSEAEREALTAMR
jgi:purine-binding chemotaxis protein CheW